MYTEKIKNIDGNWYEPLHFLQSLKNTIKAELLDTTSSAGDWNGYFIQEKNNRYYLIGFNQENNYPHGGFTLYTSNAIASGEEFPDEDEIYELMQLW